MKPLISLCMILKDESASIQQVLEAVKPFVDSWCILDTGSTDGTQEIVRKVLVDKPGTLHEHPFEGFVDSRNRAFQLDTSNAVFQLVLSGDEYLRDGTALRSFLETYRDSNIDLFKIPLIIDETRFYPPRVFRTGSPWHYVDGGLGIHEFPTHPDSTAPTSVAPGWIEHIASDPQKRFDNVWQNHIPLLREVLVAEPDNEQALLYLAQSFELLVPQLDFFHPGERITYAMEAMSYLMRRLSIPTGSDDERNYLKYRLYDMARWTRFYTPDELLARVAELCDDDPKRPETALLMLNVAMAKGMTGSQVYTLAVQTIKVATEVDGEFKTSAPRQLAITWKAHLIAAKAALLVNKTHPEVTVDGIPYLMLARRHAQAGLDAGGPEVFHEILEEVDKAEVSVPELAVQVPASS